jgi:hypothetical protein
VTLPSSPPLSLAQVRAEFGAPAGTPLHAFVRGGAWVPNVAANNNVPTAPPIRLAQLCGATKQPPFVVSGPSSVYQSSPPNGSMMYLGSGFTYSGGDGSPSFQWVQLSGSTLIYCDQPNSILGYFRSQATTSKAGSDRQAVWRLTATDAGQTYTFNLTVEFETVGTL